VTISQPKPMPIPPSRSGWKAPHVQRLLDVLKTIRDGEMVEITGATQGYIVTTAHRYGIRIETRKMTNGAVGVWRQSPRTTQRT
jgi:hypothetical protein